MTLGKRLKQQRLDKNMSMDNLVEEFNKLYGLKTTKSMVSRWENGLSTPTNAYLSAYARYFNLDLNELLGVNPRIQTGGYYTDPETAELAEKLRTDPDMKILFSAAKDLSPEEMQQAADYVNYLKTKGHNT